MLTTCGPVDTEDGETEGDEDVDGLGVGVGVGLAVPEPDGDGVGVGVGDRDGFGGEGRGDGECAGDGADEVRVLTFGRMFTSGLAPTEGDAAGTDWAAAPAGPRPGLAVAVWLTRWACAAECGCSPPVRAKLSPTASPMTAAAAAPVVSGRHQRLLADGPGVAAGRTGTGTGTATGVARVTGTGAARRTGPEPPRGSGSRARGSRPARFVPGGTGAS